MLDGLSFVASIAGLVSLADLVVIKGYRYLKSVKNCEEDVRSLIVEADVLCGVLSRLAKSLQENAEGDEASLELALESDYVYECQKTLRQINRILVDFERKAAAEPASEVSEDAAASNKAKKSIFNRLSRTDLKWPLSKSKTVELIERLERHKSTCIMALAADEMSALVQVLGQQKITNQQLAEIMHEQRKADELRLTQEFGEETKKILNWLSPVDPLQNHQAARKIYQKGTCRWLIDSPEFIQWIKTKNSAIWLYGIPGAGKTILSSLVIEEVFSLQDNGVAFYYCDYKNAASQEPTNILGSLVRQLALQEALVLTKVKDFYNSHHPAGRPSSRPTEQDLGLILQNISNSFAEVTIILDGLDECGSSPGIERSELVRILSTLHDGHAGSIRIAIASRQERDIEECFGEFTKVSIAAMSLDLELYVACEVERRAKTGRLRIRDSALKGEIIQALINGADGMFQWVKCQLDSLRGLPNDAEIRKALKELPPDLPATYVRILERLDRTLSHKAKTYLKRILKWLVLNDWEDHDSTITLPALCQAISIEDEHTRLENDAIPDEICIIEWCSSLARWNSEKNTLELSHFTVKEFLLSAEASVDSPVARKYLVHKSTDLTYLAKTCLGYLGLDDFCIVMDVNNVSGSKRFDDNFPFYKCAGSLFFDYLNIPQLEAQADLQLRRFFTPQANEKFFLWRQHFVPGSFGIVETKMEWNPGSEVNLTPLHLACELLLKNTTRRLLSEGADPNATCIYFGTPLTRLFLSGEWGFIGLPTPLWEGLSLQFTDPESGREKYEVQIYDILLSTGADVGRMVRCVGAPKHVVSGLTSPLCVALVLMKPLLLTQRLCLATANLSAEICFGMDCENLPRILRFHMEGDIGDTMPFWKDFMKCATELNTLWAQDSRFLSIMGEFFSKRWISNDAETEIKMRDNTPDQQLRLACQIGNEPAVVRLLAEGASVDAFNTKNESVLYFALKGGYWSIAFVLLEAGSDFNAEDSTGESPLQMLMGLDGEDDEYSEGVDALAFFEQLVGDNHIDIFRREAPKILHLACENVRSDIITLLLGHGVDVNVRVDGSCPIHTLLNKKDCVTEDDLTLLLEHGANVNLQDNERRTPLHLAAQRGSSTGRTLVKRLLDQEANRDEIDVDRWTPLHFACRRGDLGTVKCLLEHKQESFHLGDRANEPSIGDLDMMVGSINLATAGLDTPLSLALNGPPKPDPDLIALLLSYGASMNSILSSGRTLFDDIFSQTDLSIQHIDAASAMLRNLNAGTLKTFGSKNLCSLTRNGQFEIARCFLTAAEALGVDLEIDSSVHDAAGWGLSHYSARGDHCLSQYFPVLLRMASNALSTTEDGDSELYVAASHGNESGLRLALECSNSCQFIDTEASSGLTPLQTALRNRHFSVVSLLLNSGASLEVQDNLGLTPLCIAVDIDSPEAVGMILSHLNLRSRLTLDNPCMNVLSALHLAVKRGNLTIIRIFVGSWAEFNIPVDEGDALLQSAYKSGNSSIVKLLTESGMVRIPDVSVSSKPNIASMDNHAEQALPPLLDAVGLSQSFRFSGIDSDNIAFNIERQRSLGRSHPRSRIGRFLALPQRHNGYKPKPQSQAQTVLEILDPSLQGPSGSIWSQNGLFGASSRADARDTFSLEASIDATEHSSYINEKIGLTPLHIAAITNSAHSLGKMIDKDSGQLHVQTKDGRNALHLSLAARSANASKLLIERGVNGWVKSLLHGRPLHVASAVGDGESVRMLLSNGLTTDTAIDITSLINEPSDFFGTPLYAAAYGGHLGIVAQLLSSEANVDGAGQGNILGTPLLAACSQGHIDVVELLLARGANKNAFNRKFKSAMDLARAFQQPEVVRILE